MIIVNESPPANPMQNPHRVVFASNSAMGQQSVQAPCAITPRRILLPTPPKLEPILRPHTDTPQVKIARAVREVCRPVFGDNLCKPLRAYKRVQQELRGRTDHVIRRYQLTTELAAAVQGSVGRIHDSVRLGATMALGDIIDNDVAVFYEDLH